MRKVILPSIIIMMLLLVAGVFHFAASRHSIGAFVAQYAKASSQERMTLAREYLQYFAAKDLLQAYEKYEPTCHMVAHEMGRAVYQKTRNLDTATRTCTNACSDGCFHGALMEMFSVDADMGPLHGGAPEEIVKYASTTARSLCSRPEITSSIRPWKCLHGLGHMLAYGSGYDLSASLKACEQVDGDKFAKGLCASGVFMEFSESPEHNSVFAGADLLPCSTYPDVYAVGCFRFKGELMIHAWDNVDDIHAACRTLPEHKRYACFMGVAWGRINVLRYETDFKTLCDLPDREDQKACIEGAGSFIAINSNTEQNLCRKLPSPYKESCEWTLGNIRMFTE